MTIAHRYRLSHSAALEYARDRAILLLYLVSIAVAMSGWLWFLAWISWTVISWVLGDTS
jgi:hypothetical protein